MALKDWKKTLKNKFHTIYTNKKDATDIDIWKKEKEIEIVDGNGKRILLKSFKTKSRALAYAKAYMKKH